MDDARRLNHAQLGPVLKALRRRGWLLALCVVLGGGAAYMHAHGQPREYESIASVLFQASNVDSELFGLAPTRSSDPARDAATNLSLVTQPAVAARTAGALGAPATASTVSAAIQPTARGSTDVVDITATAHDPQQAARLATTYAMQFVAYRQRQDQAAILAGRASLERQIQVAQDTPSQRAQLPGLRDRATQLTALASVQTGNVSVLARGKAPEAASSPRVARSSVIGGLLGLVVGAMALAILTAADQRLRDVGEVETTYALPVLGEIPTSRALDTRQKRDTPRGSEADSFRLLSARMRYFNVDRKIRSVLVTSGSPGDGKSTVAQHLARAAAEVNPDGRVLLLEADLRRPTLSSSAVFTPGPGIAEVLSGQVSLEEAIQLWPVGADPSDEGPVLEVLTAGSPVPNPTELLESDRMSNLLTELADRYRLVVIDAPPAALVADALPLLSRVSGVLVVVRLGHSTRRAARALRAQLRHSEATVLGLVINGVSNRGLSSYSYYQSPEEAAKTGRRRGAQDAVQSGERLSA